MFKKSLLALALGTTASFVVLSARATTLNAGDVLTITTGTGIPDTSGAILPTGGSYFKMLGIGAGLLSAGTLGGLAIGTITSVGQIDAPPSSNTFYGLMGQDYVTVPVTGSTTAGLNMSGWTMQYYGNILFVGSGAWSQGFTSGVGNFSWDGTYGHAYTLDYHATVSGATGSGISFNGILYSLHLTGMVAAVPEATTYGMMLAGLGLVGFTARRKKRVHVT